MTASSKPFDATTPPRALPRLSRPALMQALSRNGVNAEQRERGGVMLVGVRGFHAPMLRREGADRWLYEDALFVISPEAFMSWHANLDPAGWRRDMGLPTPENAPTLKAGLYAAHRYGKLGGRDPALIQTAGPVDVTWPDLPHGQPVERTMPIRRGTVAAPAAAAGVPVAPRQWDSFIATVVDLLQRHHGRDWRARAVPLLVLDTAAEEPRA